MMLPLAALPPSWLMRSVGLTANLMSLGGLAIAIGMLVDAAVVVVENAIEALSGSPAAARHAAAARDLPRVRRGGAPVTAGVAIIAWCSCRC
jgi:cobalt-zinc-cadmium resistance protein CzcA